MGVGDGVDEALGVGVGVADGVDDALGAGAGVDEDVGAGSAVDEALGAGSLLGVEEPDEPDAEAPTKDDPETQTTTVATRAIDVRTRLIALPPIQYFEDRPCVRHDAAPLSLVRTPCLATAALAPTAYPKAMDDACRAGHLQQVNVSPTCAEDSTCGQQE